MITDDFDLVVVVVSVITGFITYVVKVLGVVLLRIFGCGVGVGVKFEEGFWYDVESVFPSRSSSIYYLGDLGVHYPIQVGFYD